MIVYGVNCTWWDSMDMVGLSESGMPGCPKCGGLLAEIESEDRWWELVELYDIKYHTGYRDMVEWSRGRCFDFGKKSAVQVLQDEYEAHR